MSDKDELSLWEIAKMGASIGLFYAVLALFGC